MSAHAWWIIAIISVSVWYLSHQAGRLDRLHHRIDVTQSSLDSHLAKRSALCMELCSTDALDPVTSALLVQAAHEALNAGEIDTAQRQDAESELSDVLSEIFDSPDGLTPLLEDPVLAGLLSQLEQVCRRIVLAHTFHSDAVRDCLLIRQQTLVKVLRLSGRAPLPRACVMQLNVPAAFAK